MAAKKKPVGRSPICSAEYLRQIDPIWVYGPVPNRFWQEESHRRDYLLWLGQKLRFRWMRDWYKISHEDVKRHHGAGLANTYWNASAIEGVKQCFPDYEWHEWLFVCAPHGFWKGRENCRRYMDWLGQQLGYGCPEDWYAVSIEDFLDHQGGAFLGCKGTLTNAVISYLPEYDWKEWLFTRTPQRFWSIRRNRIRYMKWLGARLGYQRAADWYRVTDKDFKGNYGGECLKYHHSSVIATVRDVFPRRIWHEWMFARVPIGFWELLENRQRYVRWLGKRLRLRRAADWYRLRLADFTENYGGGLVFSAGSYLTVLKECLPELDWNSWSDYRPVAADACEESIPHSCDRNGAAFAGRRRRARPRPLSSLTIEDILSWADAHHQRVGRWPKRAAGAVFGVPGETWSTINAALYFGHRGLPGKSSLPRLLAQHRGVRNQRDRPRLTVRQILQWADEHRARTGNWPTTRSGAIEGVAFEAWFGIDQALRNGYRGLSGSTSLSRLLAPRRRAATK